MRTNDTPANMTAEQWTAWARLHQLNNRLDWHGEIPHDYADIALWELGTYGEGVPIGSDLADAALTAGYLERTGDPRKPYRLTARPERYPAGHEGVIIPAALANDRNLATIPTRLYIAHLSLIAWAQVEAYTSPNTETAALAARGRLPTNIADNDETGGTTPETLAGLIDLGLLSEHPDGGYQLMLWHHVQRARAQLGVAPPRPDRTTALDILRGKVTPNVVRIAETVAPTGSTKSAVRIRHEYDYKNPYKIEPELIGWTWRELEAPSNS